jgi:SNF2 family DNA or RNA helicase
MSATITNWPLTLEQFLSLPEAELLKPPTELLLSMHGPIEWPANLFGYQLHGITGLLPRDALLLADDLGLGKTVHAIAALRILLLQHQVEAGLIVVPASLVDQWRYAIRQWAPELRVSTIRGPGHERAWQWLTPAHIYLTSYDTLCEDYTDNPQAPPRRRTWDVVILDEAHGSRTVTLGQVAFVSNCFGAAPGRSLAPRWKTR